MHNKYFLFVLLFCKVIASNGQVDVSLRIDEILANSWMDFDVPTINSIQVKSIDYVVVNGISGEAQTISIPVEFCQQYISFPETRTEWHKVPYGFFTANFKIDKFLNKNYYAIVNINMRGYQKKGINNLCECEDKLRWDPDINCFKTPFGKVCLGGFVGPFDKYCNDDYTVSIRIDSNSVPYIKNYTIRENSISTANKRYGAVFEYVFTAPSTLMSDIVGASVLQPVPAIVTDLLIKPEIVCSNDSFILKASGGFNGVIAYDWYVNSKYLNRSLVDKGLRSSTIKISRENGSTNEMEEKYSTVAVYSGGEQSAHNTPGPSLAMYIHPPRPNLTIDNVNYMSCYNSKDNYIDLSATSSVGINNFRFEILGITSYYNEAKNGNPVRFSGLDGNDNPPLYQQYFAIAENIVTRANGSIGYSCPSPIDTFSMRNPRALLIDNLDIITYNGAQVQCKDSSNGRIDVLASGGTAPYEYAKDVFANFQSDKRFNGLAPNNLYTFYVKDANGCDTSQTLSLTEPDYVNASKVASVYNDFYNINCKGGNDGIITFNTATGGTSPYRYSVDSGKVYRSSTVFSGLKAGTYNLKVLDVNNCIFTDTINLIEPEHLKLDTVRTVQPACFGFNDGLIELVADGGVKHKPYRFSIENYFLPYIKTPSSPAYYNDSATFRGLQTFDYLFKITDANNCTTTKSVFLRQPDSISIQFDTKDITCNGSGNGKLTAIVTGGSRPYSYTWTGGTISIVNSPTASSVDNLKSDLYTLRVTDGQNCNSIKQQVVLEPRPLYAYVNKVVNVTCYDGNDASIEILSGGGYAPHSYSLNGGSFVTQRNIFDTLSAGKYVVTVRDAGGCELTLPEVEITKPNALTAHVETEGVACSYLNNGIINVQASGGSGGYAYAYGYDGNFTSFNTFYNLSSGWHTIRVKDSKNCILNREVFVSAPEPLRIYLESSGPSDCGAATGSALVYANGGTSPYTYFWMNQQADGNSIVNLPMGVHPIVVMDAKQCKDTMLVGISDISGPVVSVSNITPPGCYDSDNGSATVEVQGGNNGYVFQWYDPANQTGPSAYNLREGNYLVKVTDASNCGTVKTIVLDAPEKQQIVVDRVTPSLCHSDCNGSISVSGYGGTEPYNLTWNDPSAQSGGIAKNLCEGIYKITLTDVNGCEDTLSISLINPSPIDIAIPDSIKLCTNQVKKLNAGNAGSTYSWTGSNGFISKEQTVDISQSGNYTLTVTNENNCTASRGFNVQIVHNLLKANFLVKGKNTTQDTLAFVDVSDPKPEKIEWEFTDNATVINKNGPYAFVTYPGPGNYVVKLTAYLGSCLDEITKEVRIYEPQDLPDNQRLASGKKLGIVKFGIYPNPNNGDFMAEVVLDSVQDVTFTVYDMLGNKVTSVSRSEGSIYKQSFNLLTYQAKQGLYIIHAETATDRRSITFSIQ